MKNRIINLSAAFLTALSAGTAQAALNIPSDGSDGVLVISGNTVIDLSQAVTGNWDANNSANAGKGIYDPAKWAVVFKYSSVTIQGGATVRFANHASRAPVVWLVQGDVAVAGAVALDGQDAHYDAPHLAEPGPGGFRGGSGYYTVGAASSSGFGPGGGGPLEGWSADWSAGGSYATVAPRSLVAAYGNPSLIALIGGSGGGGALQGPRGGGGGGGAILIACSGSLSLSGSIRANGGSGDGTAGGSGGGVRLVANSMTGSGTINCLGGGTSFYGGLGRIRLERFTNALTSDPVPAPSIAQLTDGDTPLIWPPTNSPSVRIVSVGGNTAPADPGAAFGTVGADVVLPDASSTTVLLETTNVEQNSSLTVRVTPRSNGTYTETAATVSQVLSQDPLVVRWTANVPVVGGYSALQVRVVRP